MNRHKSAKMDVTKRAVKYLSILMMLILASSASTVIDGPSEILQSRERKLSQYRLPNNTIPQHYQIILEPFMNLEELTWIGDVHIDIQVIEPTSVITLHAHSNIKILEQYTELFDDYGSSMIPIKHDRIDAVDLLELKFEKNITPQRYTLSIKFTGRETCCFTGFFKHNIGGNRTVAATSFEPTAARRAFPCWDEPALKARFHLSIKHFSNYTIISNMPKTRFARNIGDKMHTDFVTTPVMSTYLLNFVIADYPTITNNHGNVSLYTRLPLENVQYLLDHSSKVVNVMESYTGVPYGLPRVGSVLIPFYPTNATEHWGLSSYNEESLNGNKSLFTSAQNDSAHLMIANELAHSWFGNRVTPLWWDDLWLNEGFAAYFQYYIMDQIDDKWGGVDLFVLSNNYESAFPTDTNDKIHIKTIPYTENEIKQQFKPSTYQKGAAIVHMLRKILGDNVFQAGIKKYMTRHSFNSVVTDDLLRALQEAHDEGENKDKPLNIKVAISPWLEHKGYPILKVTRNYTSGEGKIAQRTTANNDIKTLWWIPLTFATNSEPTFSSTIPSGWISDKTEIEFIDEIGNDDWLIVNVQASGYYRVNYDDENWNRLANYLNTDNYKDIHVLNRAQLISDSFYLAQNEPDTYYSIFYNIIKYLARENEYLPWRAAHYAITRIAESLPKSSEAHRLFTHYIFELMQNIIEKVGFEPKDNDDHYIKLARMDIIHWACIHGQTGCANYAAQKILKLVEDSVKNPLHPDIRSWVFCAGLRGLNEIETEKFAMWAYENANDLLIKNLACTKNHKVHKHILSASLKVNNTGDPHTTTGILKTLLTSSDENFNYAVNFIIEHQNVTETVVTHESLEIGNILATIADEVKTKAQLEKFKQIFNLNVIAQDPKISEIDLTRVARLHIARSSIDINRFLKRWDKQLSTDDNDSNDIF